MTFLRNAKRDSLHQHRDEELLAAFRQTREAQYFALLFDRYAKALYNFCHTYLDHEEDSRDAVMHIFSKSLEQVPHNSIRHFKNWLFFLARNECINQLRERERQNEGQSAYTYLQTMTIPPAEWEDHRETPELRLGRALSQLRVEQRACLELFYFEEKSYREIALQTDFSLKEVKSNLQNGRRKLKKLLKSGFTSQSPDSY